MELLVDAEMKMFKGIRTPVIFLQNVITDLLLGLGMSDVLKAFHDYVIKKHNAEAGFITMNMPMLLTALKMQAFKTLLYALPSTKQDSGCQVEKKFMKKPCVLKK